MGTWLEEGMPTTVHTTEAATSWLIDKWIKIKYISNNFVIYLSKQPLNAASSFFNVRIFQLQKVMMTLKSIE